VAFSARPGGGLGPCSNPLPFGEILFDRGYPKRYMAKSGSGSLSVSVSQGRVMGFVHEKPGTATVLLRYWQNLAAKFERPRRAKCHSEQESIPIPIPTPTPIQTMI
jgi:hypothetical protein